MTTIKQSITEITNPLRRNNLEARRRKLGLSRAALGRILDVDPPTVFRRERGPLVALWDHAMRGIEVEAASGQAKQYIREYNESTKRASRGPLFRTCLALGVWRSPPKK